MTANDGRVTGAAPARLVILARPDPVQIYTTNRVAGLIPVAAVISEVGRDFAERHRRRFRSFVRREGVWGAIDRYLDLAYFKMRTRLDRHDEIVRRLLGQDGNPRSWDAGLEVHEVQNVNSAESVELLRRLAPDILFCNGSSILKKRVIEIPPLGVVNIHTGVVPDYRGPSPEFWALHNGDFDKVGVTVHMLTEEIDAGDVLLEERTTVGPDDNEITLRCRNVRAGARLVAEAVRAIAAGEARPIPQDESRAHSWPKRTRREDRAMRRRLRAWRRSRADGAAGSAPAGGGTERS